MAALLDTKKLALVISALVFLGGIMALIVDGSELLVKAATPLGIACSGLAGVAAGAIAARTFAGGAIAGAAAGFANAVVGVVLAMALRDVGWSALGGGALGGALLGAITGPMGHLLLLVVQRRGQPLQR